ncbi:hypothetical protein [Allopusillimonas ginsengisoli]|uniref:hypothetical protein n=1 Tax=Allopusillimonas ginsengisoli TaxID=453575 RepID=UPI00101EEC8A|nr:hypothetical protein [Allopusillimonas ginsengisoli]TEA79814.1 hypothetical protein ERE07_02410 [Allopusillimonas ginsengisoli]
MKSAADLRLENLELLIAEAGTAEALARLCDLSPEYLSQIRNRALDRKTGRPRNLGNQAARKLEQGTGKQLGWMDTSHADRQIEGPLTLDWPLRKVTVERLQALTTEQRQRADAAMDDLLRGYEAERAAKTRG